MVHVLPPASDRYEAFFDPACIQNQSGVLLLRSVPGGITQPKESGTNKIRPVRGRGEGALTPLMSTLRLTIMCN
ncbi:protein of unknown function [Serratia sp. Tan611]|nr:protein of unknown function [Serratia sp. Tan611]